MVQSFLDQQDDDDSEDDVLLSTCSLTASEVIDASVSIDAS